MESSLQVASATPVWSSLPGGKQSPARTAIPALLPFPGDGRSPAHRHPAWGTDSGAVTAVTTSGNGPALAAAPLPHAIADPDAGDDGMTYIAYLIRCQGSLTVVADDDDAWDDDDDFDFSDTEAEEERTPAACTPVGLP